VKKKLLVCETFISIQGETTWSGWPCFFIRLAGCNLRCRYCDTKYAWRGGRARPILELAAGFAAAKTPLAEITGGEPLLQENVYDLLKLLLRRRKGKILLETNGACDTARVPDGVITILDIKCPGSGFANTVHWKNIPRLKTNDEVKFVICSRKDYEWARRVTEKHRLAARCKAVNFSPAAGFLKPRTLASWIARDGLPVRFNLQLHRQIWPQAERAK
jgi:7-carboxy-7-deazaguanine synthase